MMDRFDSDKNSPAHSRALADFWGMPPREREAVLAEAILAVHAWHYARNRAYRHTVTARGVGPKAGPEDLPRLLRPTAQTFKSYIELLGTPFPEDCPHAFLEWLADQLSVELPRGRFGQFRRRYRSLEALLREIERVFAALSLEVSTSSGTSGRSTIMVRDRAGVDRTAESFYLSFQRYMGMKADHKAIFLMPQQTRIAMARMARFSVERVGMRSIHFAIPFPAHPDQVRVRAGQTFRPGWHGAVEKRIEHPFMSWMQDHYVTPNAVRRAIQLARQAEAAGEKVLMFGGWVQLDAMAQTLKAEGHTLRLAPGSLLGTGGGLKEIYPFAPAKIRQHVAETVELADGQPIPVHDVYGMAEGNWAAMQCAKGNYHIPPWIYAVTLDDDDKFQEASEATGLLAFFDPFGGGQLFPSFFRTADRVRLVDPAADYDPAHDCPCGDPGAYICQDSIQRVDLLDQAGCAAQI